MKVLFNCISSVSGGGRAYLRNLPNLLLQNFAEHKQHEIVFLAHRDQAELLSGLPQSIIEWVEGKRLDGIRRISWERNNLPTIVAEHKADVVFTPYQVAPYIAGVKNILMIRNMEPFLFGAYAYSSRTWLRNKVLAIMSENCLRKADRVIAVSRFSASQLSRINVLPERIQTIHHGRPVFLTEDNANTNNLATLGVDGEFMLTCGSMLPYRRIEDVIEGFNDCLPVLPKNMRLVVAGSGADVNYARSIRKLIASSPDPSRILAVGNVSWSTMIELYSNCTLFVIATEIEACPNIALEAMSAGCCIVSSDRPPLPEMFNGCVLSYQARDIESLAFQMLRGLQDETLRRQLRETAVRRSLAFSWSECAKKTYSALTDW